MNTGRTFIDDPHAIMQEERQTDVKGLITVRIGGKRTMHDTDAHSRTKSWRWLLVVPIPVIGIVLVWIGIVSLSSPAGEHQPIGLSPLPSTPPDSLLLLTTPTPPPDALPTRSSDTPTPPQDVVIYITGAVNEPGVYQLPPDARVTDVVFAAGGLKGEAAGEYINLAAPIEDAQHIHVPRREDLQQQRVSSPGESYASSSFPTTSPPSANAAAHTASYQWGQGNGGKGTEDMRRHRQIVSISTMLRNVNCKNCRVWER